jgi:hypothetical protein
MIWLVEQGPGAVLALILSGAGLLWWSAGRQGLRWAGGFLALALVGAGAVLAADRFMPVTDTQLLIGGLGAMLVAGAVVGIWAGVALGLVRRLANPRPTGREKAGSRE